MSLKLVPKGFINNVPEYIMSWVNGGSGSVDSMHETVSSLLCTYCRLDMEAAQGADNI